MNEQAIKAEARLEAIEYLLALVYAKMYLQMPDPVEQVGIGINRLRGKIEQATIPGIDAPLSDLAMAEFQEAVEALLSMIREMVETETSHLSGGAST